MPRKIKDQALDTRAARQRLKPRGKPYWRAIESGEHLGYRRLTGKAGTWCVRHYLGEQSYQVESIGIADDLSDADGVAILNFWQAQERVRTSMVGRAHAAAGKPLIVADAIEDYLQFLEDNRKTGADARYRANAHILPELGEIEVADLTADKIRKWHSALAKASPRLRTKPGEKQNLRNVDHDDETKRRRKSTANRMLTILKAALNYAWREKPKQVPSNAEWSRVEPFQDVDAARVRYLTIAEAQRLINASPADFRQIVQAALQTGARYGELIALRVSDFNRDSGTVAIRKSKSGKARHIVLTDEGVEFFKMLCAGRASNEIMLRKVTGEPWQKSHQARPMTAACQHGKIKPEASFHILRHTYASHAIMNGAPLMVVAKNLGHSDTRMVEKHYGHLAPSYIADAIRAAAPRFGKPDSNVAVL